MSFHLGCLDNEVEEEIVAGAASLSSEESLKLNDSFNIEENLPESPDEMLESLERLEGVNDEMRDKIGHAAVGDVFEADEEEEENVIKELSDDEEGVPATDYPESPDEMSENFERIEGVNEETEDKTDNAAEGDVVEAPEAEEEEENAAKEMFGDEESDAEEFEVSVLALHIVFQQDCNKKLFRHKQMLHAYH